MTGINEVNQSQELALVVAPERYEMWYSFRAVFVPVWNNGCSRDGRHSLSLSSAFARSCHCDRCTAGGTEAERNVFIAKTGPA
jgi:hypothetical protein